MAASSVQKTILPNGVRLLLIPMEGVESIATSVMVGVGSRYETRNINGISHFLEHMVFKGTEKYPTTEDVNVIERVGGLQNAYTDIDITNYHNKTLAADWELGLEINKELAIKPRLEQKYVDRERDVILEEMKRYEDEPSAKVEEVYHSMMYPRATLGMRIIGEEDSLKAADSTTLHTYHDAWYKPDRMVVVLAGKIEGSSSADKQESRIKEMVNEWFGNLSGKAQGSFEPAIDVQKQPMMEVVTKPDANQAHFEIGLRTFARGSDERFAWSVFNLLMGVSFTSRLFREIREKRGLCYQIRSTSSNWADVGYWSIYAGVATEKVGEAVWGVMEELKKARDGGVTSDEVAVAKKRLITMLAFKAEDPEFQNEYYGRQELFGEPLLTLEEYIKRVEGVTKEEINSLVKKYFVTNNLNLALVWNKPKEEKLLGYLKI